MKIKKFLGTSAQSVKAQILVALIAYLLVHLLKYSMKSDISMPDAMAAIGRRSRCHGSWGAYPA